MVNVKVARTAPGFMGGKNGTTNYGTDPKAPWGKMHHHFWPRCSVEGSIITKTGEIDVKGRGMLSHALQGMKPHHAGKLISIKTVIFRLTSQLRDGILSTSNPHPIQPF